MSTPQMQHDECTTSSRLKGRLTCGGQHTCLHGWSTWKPRGKRQRTHNVNIAQHPQLYDSAVDGHCKGVKNSDHEMSKTKQGLLWEVMHLS